MIVKLIYFKKSSSQGYNQFDLLKMARAQGFTQADIENLDKRFKSAQTIARVAESASLHWKKLDLENNG